MKLRNWGTMETEITCLVQWKPDTNNRDVLTKMDIHQSKNNNPKGVSSQSLGIDLASTEFFFWLLTSWAYARWPEWGHHSTHTSTMDGTS
jgi:hypothetical protein